MYYQMGRLTRSEQTYTQALKKFPLLTGTEKLGICSAQPGKLDEASKKLAKAISLGEADGISYVAWVTTLARTGGIRRNAYRIAILLHPESIDAQWSGQLSAFHNRFAEALALLDELLEAKPNDLFCHKARASALQGLNREEDAVSL